MKIIGVVTEVKEQRSQTKQGVPVTYRDVFIADTSADPLTRFNGEVVIRPNEAEWQTQSMKRGDKFNVSIMQVLELRSGNPVVRAHCEPITPTK